MPITHDYLNTSGYKPTAAEAATGELIPNVADGTLWTKNTTGTVIQIGGSGINPIVANFTATAGQTVFSTVYNTNNVAVYVSGVKLRSTQYTASNGTSVTLNDGVSAGTWVHIVSDDSTGGGLAWSNITGTPTTISGYGITNAVTTNTTQSITASKTLNDNIHLNLGTDADVEHFFGGANYYTDINTGDWFIRDSVGTTKFTLGIATGHFQATAVTASGSLTGGNINSPNGNISAFNGTVSGNTLSSGVATGTAPLTVYSTTLVTNLNADKVDGIEANQLLRSDAADVKTSGTLKFNDNIDLDFGSSNDVSFTWDGSRFKTTTLDTYFWDIENMHLNLSNNRGILLEDSTGTSGTGLIMSSTNNITLGESGYPTYLSGQYIKALKGVYLTKDTITASNINVRDGSVFTKTISANTTFTVSNVPVTTNVPSFILELTNAGAYTITWWSGMKWEGGSAPTLTTSGTDILGFYTHDGGTTWRGVVMALDSK